VTNAKGLFWVIMMLSLILSACAAAPAATQESSEKPEWFGFELTDVNSGETFTINDFQGKVVLVDSMATWCPTCIRQQMRIKELDERLGDRDDFVIISQDVDPKEDVDMLKEYAAKYEFDWIFVVSNREVYRALANLYGASYINPPTASILVIDREGKTYTLPSGLKETDELYEAVSPLLDARK
jgi:cytochrome oxidase Cu insertion factor (SCO1/SenC/PrrC family)